MKSVRNHKDIRLVTTDKKKRSKLVSEPNHDTAKWSSECLIAIEMKKNNSKNGQTYLFMTFNLRFK